MVNLTLHVWQDLTFFTIWWTQCWTMPCNSTSILNYSTSFVCRLNACPNLVDISFIRNHIDIVSLETNGYIRKYRRLSICIKQVDHQIYKALKNPKGEMKVGFYLIDANFLCIYIKLVEIPQFKHLLTNLFIYE